MHKARGVGGGGIGWWEDKKDHGARNRSPVCPPLPNASELGGNMSVPPDSGVRCPPGTPRCCPQAHALSTGTMPLSAPNLNQPHGPRRVQYRGKTYDRRKPAGGWARTRPGGRPRKPTSGLPRKPTSGLPRKPTSGLLRKPTSGLPRKPTSGLQRKPTSGLQRKPTSGLQRKPTSGLRKRKPTSGLRKRHGGATVCPKRR